MPPSATFTEALSAEIESHRREVQNYLHGSVGCADTAADLFQSIVENMLGRDSGDRVGNIRAYLFQAARNAVVNHHRSETTRGRQAQQLADSREHLIAPGPEAVLESRQQLAQLNTALRDLPLLTRQMFLLYRLHGLRQEEIAAQFDVHLSTVEKRIRKALLHCHDRLQR